MDNNTTRLDVLGSLLVPGQQQPPECFGECVHCDESTGDQNAQKRKQKSRRDKTEKKQSKIEKPAKLRATKTSAAACMIVCFWCYARWPKQKEPVK